MRYMQWIAVATSAVALCGCFEGTLDFQNSEIYNGKIYESKAKKPFSGNVTNIPFSRMPTKELGRFLDVVANGTKDRSFSAISIAVMGAGSDMLCDSQVDKGTLDGNALCSVANGKGKLFDIPYKQGVIDGKFIVYNPTKQGEIVARASFANGVLEGKSEVHSLKTGAVVDKLQWEKGQPVGTEEMFDETTGNLVFKASFTNGRYQGEVLRYAPDGKTLVIKANYSDGVLDGPYEEFDSQTGALIKRSIFKHGVKQADGAVQNSGNATLSAEQVIGEAISGNSVEGSSQRVCVDGWIAAHRKQVGNEAMISADQLGEWESWCKAGKLPPG